MTATTTKLARGYYAVQFRQALHHGFGVRVGFVGEDGVMEVGGCRPGRTGMVGKILSKPWRSRGGDYWTMSKGDVCAVLADGTEVRLGEYDRGVATFVANGKVYESAMAAALELTPA